LSPPAKEVLKVGGVRQGAKTCHHRPPTGSIPGERCEEGRGEPWDNLWRGNVTSNRDRSRKVRSNWNKLSREGSLNTRRKVQKKERGTGRSRSFRPPQKREERGREKRVKKVGNQPTASC